MFDRYWDTAIGVMNHTQDTFNEMRITGGIGSPFKFLMLGAVLGSLIAAVYGLIGNAITVISASGVLEELEKEATAEAGAAAAGAVVTGRDGYLHCVSVFRSRSSEASSEASSTSSSKLRDFSLRYQWLVSSKRASRKTSESRRLQTVRSFCATSCQVSVPASCYSYGSKA